MNTIIHGLTPLRWGQFFLGLSFFAAGFSLALASGAAAIPTAGLSAVTAVSGAVMLSYGLGNMVAAFSPYKDRAKAMLDSPKNLGNAITQVVFHDDGPAAKELGGMSEDVAAALFSDDPLSAALFGLQFILPVMQGAGPLDEECFMQDF